jgi:hypothetical protein
MQRVAKDRDCTCFPLVLKHVPTEALVCIILEYSHIAHSKHAYIQDGELNLHVDVTPHRSVCRRTKGIKHCNAYNMVPRAVIMMMDRKFPSWDGPARPGIMFTMHLTAPRHRDVVIEQTIDLDQGCIRFLFDPKSSPKALLETVRRSKKSETSFHPGGRVSDASGNPQMAKITVATATMFYKACMVLRDELREILYEIHHDCPRASLIYS